VRFFALYNILTVSAFSQYYEKVLADFFRSKCLTRTNVSLLSKFVKQVGLVQVHSVAEIYKNQHKQNVLHSETLNIRMLEKESAL